MSSSDTCTEAAGLTRSRARSRLAAPLAVALVVALVVGADGWTGRLLDPDHRASAVLFIVGRGGGAPAAVETAEPVPSANPLTRARSGGNQRGAALVEMIESAVALAKLTGTWPAGVEHAAVQLPRSPIVDVRLTGPDRPGSMAALDLVVGEVAADVARRQAGTARDMRYEVQVLRRSAEPTVTFPPRTRIRAVVVLLTLLAVAAAWSFCRRTRAVRSRRGSGGWRAAWVRAWRHAMSGGPEPPRTTDWSVR